jgi:hypothetical protein
MGWDECIVLNGFVLYCLTWLDGARWNGMACWYGMRCDAMGWDMDVGLSDFTLVSLALWLLRLCGMAVPVIGGRRRGRRFTGARSRNA